MAYTYTWHGNWQRGTKVLFIIGDDSVSLPNKAKNIMVDVKFILILNIDTAYIVLLYPRPTECGIGVYWIHPDVCPSVCPSVRPSVRRQVFRNFLKKLLAQLISYLEFALMGWVSWPLYIFVFLASFLDLWWPNIWPKMGFQNVLKKLLAQFISYLTFTLMGWVSWPLYIFVFQASFSALWWRNYWPKMEFPEHFEKLLAHLIS